LQANQEIFLLVAEEMSISRAAQRAFVSQQCVSDHIKRMEQNYLLCRIHPHNRNCPEEEYIHILPVKNFNKFLQIDLVSLNYIEKPLYVQAFEETAVRAIQKNYLAGI